MADSDLNKDRAKLRADRVAFEEHHDSLRDAMNDLTQELANLKKADEAGEPRDLMALAAAVDNVTAAVGDATGHGAKPQSASEKK